MLLTVNSFVHINRLWWTKHTAWDQRVANFCSMVKTPKSKCAAYWCMKMMFPQCQPGVTFRRHWIVVTRSEWQGQWWALSSMVTVLRDAGTLRSKTRRTWWFYTKNRNKHFLLFQGGPDTSKKTQVLYCFCRHDNIKVISVPDLLFATTGSEGRSGNFDSAANHNLSRLSGAASTRQLFYCSQSSRHLSSRQLSSPRS